MEFLVMLTGTRLVSEIPAFERLNSSNNLPLRRLALFCALFASLFTLPALPGQTPRAAAPTFSVAAGSYPGAQTVSIADTTPGATIYYTTDGAYPGTYSTVYSTPITVSRSEILVAVAYASGYIVSPFASAEYLIASSSDRFTYSVAGDGDWGFAGDGGPASAAQLNTPQAAVADGQGNLYIADTYNNRIRKVDATTGIITTIAGTGTASDTGDTGPAVSATLWQPTFLALDNHGNLYIAETGDSVVRDLNLATGVITRAAGNPTPAIPAPQSGPATTVPLHEIVGLACDPVGNLFIGETDTIVKVDLGGYLTVIASYLTTPNLPYFGPGFAMDANHNFYLSKIGYGQIYKLDNSGAVSLFAGSGYVLNGDGGPAINASLGFMVDLTTDSSGNLYIADGLYNSIRKIDVTTGIIDTVAGVFLDPSTVGGDGDPATSSGLIFPQYISLDANGNIYLADVSSRVRKITAPAPPPTTPAAPPTLSLQSGTFPLPQSLTVSSSTLGSYAYLSFDGSTPTTALNIPYHGAIDLTGSAAINAITVAPGYLKSSISTGTYTIGQPPKATISTVAGMGYFGFTGDGGPATVALLGSPSSIAFRPDGGYYVAESSSNVVRLVAAGTGTISLVAGNGTPGFSGDGGPATAAQFNNPTGVAIDSAGNLYIADSWNRRVRKVDATTGVITTFAGAGTGPLGDGGLATAAGLGELTAVATDSLGNLYIADAPRVRIVNLTTNIISTVAGGGNATSAPFGDGGPATSAYINPNAIALDPNNNLYISDLIGRIRRVDAATHIITTIAGGGSTMATDGVQATSVAIEPYGVAIDAKQNVYFSNGDLTVREVLSDGTLATIAGNTYYGYSGDGGEASIASLAYPRQIAFDANGNLFLPDNGNDVVRKVTFLSPAGTPTFNLAAGAYTGVQTVTISSTSPNAAIYYTTDGSTPNTGSTLYSGPVTISQSETLQAIAISSGFSESAVASAAYTITIPTPTVAVASSAASAFLSNPVTFTANVAGSPGTPTGTVTFFDGTTQLGTGTLSSGVATYSTSTLAAGTHTIGVSYSGDANFKPATSTTMTETIVDFTLTTPTGSSSSTTISAGATATYTLAVTPSSGSTTPAAITLAVTGAPAGSTTTFSPTSVASGSGATSITLSIGVPAAAAVRVAGNNHLVPFSKWPVALGALLFPLLGLRRVRRAIPGRALILVLMLAGAGVLFGCGGGSSKTPPPQPQNYTLTVTAASGSLSHTTTVTLTVQ